MTETEVTPEADSSSSWKSSACNAAAFTGAVLGAALGYGVSSNATFVRTLSGDITLTIAGALTHGLVACVATLALLAIIPARKAPQSPGVLGVVIGAFVTFEWEAASRLLLDAMPMPGQGGSSFGLVAFGVISLVSLITAILAYRGLAEREGMPSKAIQRAVAVVGILGLIAGLEIMSPGSMTWTNLVSKDDTSSRGEPLGGQPNILWVTIDTIRADHMSAYQSKVRTPAFDALAREGVLFEQAIAQIPVTGPSHTTMQTGTGPWTHGALLNGIPVPDDLETFPELLHTQGYATGAFVSAVVLERSMKLSRGFEVYDDDFSWLQGSGKLAAWRTIGWGKRFLNPDIVVERVAGRTVDNTLNWLDQQPTDVPWLAWVHLFDPHGPYEPPEPFDAAYYSGDPRDPSHTSMDNVNHVAAYLKKSLEGIRDTDYVIAQYDGEISYTDLQIARLLQFLDQQELADNTVVIINGDHGESLGENGIWFDHGDDLYDAVTHVPWAIRYPGQIKPNTVVSAPVELVDLAPTLLHYLEVDRPDTFEGRSLKPVIEGHKPLRTSARAIAFDRPANRAAREAGEITQPTYRIVALRSNDWLFVRRDAPNEDNELYDLTTDPGQTENILPEISANPEHQQMLEDLTLEADHVLAMGVSGVQRSNADLSAEQTEKLRALGYIE